MLLMAAFLDFCEDFLATNCANDANGPHRIAHIAVIAGGPFASFAQFAAQILVAACRAVLDRSSYTDCAPQTFTVQAVHVQYNRGQEEEMARVPLAKKEVVASRVVLN